MLITLILLGGDEEQRQDGWSLLDITLAPGSMRNPVSKDEARK